MDYITQIIIISGLFVAATIGFGLLFALINRQNAKLIQRSFGWPGICFFGCIGVPVHELSHLLMAAIFGHKITEVSLFRPRKGKVDGVLGYVRHSYKDRLFQKMGNFFIGAAPMLTGAVLIRFLIYTQTTQKKLPPLVLTSLKEVIKYVKAAGMQVFFSFSGENMRKPVFWLIFFIILGIAVNMNMSRADVRNSMHGIVSLFIVTAVICAAMHVIGGMAYAEIVCAYMGMLLQYVAVLSYAAVICFLIMGILSLIRAVVSV